MARRTANINATLYDGDFFAGYDCVGEHCTLARFYVEPPAEDDECVFVRNGGGCTHPHAQRAALEALREAITAELKQFEEA
jgi:DNA-directed RNA polymerase subunit L